MRKFTTSWIEESGPIDPEALIRLAPGIYYRKNYLSNPKKYNDMDVQIIRKNLRNEKPENIVADFINSLSMGWDGVKHKTLFLDGDEITGIGPAGLAAMLEDQRPRVVVFSEYDRWPTTYPIIVETVARHRVKFAARIMAIAIKEGPEDRININPKFSK